MDVFGVARSRCVRGSAGSSPVCLVHWDDSASSSNASVSRYTSAIPSPKPNHRGTGKCPRRANRAAGMFNPRIPVLRKRDDGLGGGKLVLWDTGRLDVSSGVSP